MTLALSIALMGGLGATLRFLTDHAISARWGRTLPWGTIAINIVGSFFGGIIVGASLGSHSAALLLTGLFGGFTTASTFSWEVAGLFRSQRFFQAIAVAAGTMALALGAGCIGFISTHH